MSGAAWALVAALGFGFGQVLNRKANQIIDAYRTAFGLLSGVVIVLAARALVTGDAARLAEAPVTALAAFAAATFLHFVGGWTLLALSQQTIGVARTGALIGAAPVVATILAWAFLDERVRAATFVGVLAAASGVALISLSGGGHEGERRWARPWYALAVAILWGTSPLLIRSGLAGFPHPVLGLTVGLAVSVTLYAIGLAFAGAFRRRPAMPARAVLWLAAGGVVGAVAISAQWISYDLTTIAVAITIQQLATLVVIALVPFFFHEPFERMNPVFLAGTSAMLGGTALVVLS